MEMRKCRTIAEARGDFFIYRLFGIIPATARTLRPGIHFLGRGKALFMQQTEKKTLEQVAEECGRYPIDAFEFVRHGLNFTVQKVHGDTKNKAEIECHVTGRQLSEGLRDYAIMRYGVMASTVLQHWGIRRTSDFGRIVYVMVESRLMQKTEEDDVRDFEGVFDFEEAFEPPVRPTIKPMVVFML
jgi:uncharacterized repeat protein (TIGR04138 family)